MMMARRLRREDDGPGIWPNRNAPRRKGQPGD